MYVPLWKFFRDLASNLGAFLAAEIFISPRLVARSRRPKTRRDYWRDLAEMKISAAKNAPRLLARSLGGQKRAEITGEISARWKSRRPKTRRDYWRDLAEMIISAAKNAPRLLARSRRDENLGGQKRAEIIGEISPRWKSRRPKTRRDYWRDLGEMKISAAKNAPRLEARSRLPKSRRDYERSRRIKSRRVKWRDVGGENGAKMNPRRPKTWRESLGGQRENGWMSSCYHFFLHHPFLYVLFQRKLTGLFMRAIAIFWEQFNVSDFLSLLVLVLDVALTSATPLFLFPKSKFPKHSYISCAAYQQGAMAIICLPD